MESLAEVGLCHGMVDMLWMWYVLVVGCLGMCSFLLDSKDQFSKPITRLNSVTISVHCGEFSGIRGGLNR
jgi:hypothetical protein